MKQTLPKLSAASSTWGSKCPVRSPHVEPSKLESGPTPSEKTRPAMSVSNYNQIKSSGPGSVYSLKVSFSVFVLCFFTFHYLLTSRSSCFNFSVYAVLFFILFYHIF